MDSHESELEKLTCQKCKRELVRIISFAPKSPVCRECKAEYNKKFKLRTQGKPTMAQKPISFAFNDPKFRLGVWIRGN